MVFVCRAHLQRWRRSVADLHQLALRNLQRRGGASVAEFSTGDPVLLQTGDGYDAARVLLLPESEGLLVALPDRDTLWIGHEEGNDLVALMRQAGAMARAAPHPVSQNLYRVRDGYLEPVRAKSSR
jgi:hypothetical protein